MTTMYDKVKVVIEVDFSKDMSVCEAIGDDADFDDFENYAANYVQDLLDSNKDKNVQTRLLTVICPLDERMRSSGATGTIVDHKNKKICVECFLALPSNERNGRGALNASWVPENTKKTECQSCGKACYDLEDVENEQG